MMKRRSRKGGAALPSGLFALPLGALEHAKTVAGGHQKKILFISLKNSFVMGMPELSPMTESTSQ